MDNYHFLRENGDGFGKSIVTPHYGTVHSYNESTFQTNTTIYPPQTQCDISKVGSIENISYASFMVILLLASVVGNSLVVMATLLSKSLKNRVTVYFIVSLACSDLLFAVFLIPFNISMKLHDRFCHDIVSCYLMIYSDTLCNVASILNLFLIAIDRFIAIKMPFRYQSLLSKTRAKILIACVWIFSMCWALIGLFKWSDEKNKGGILSVKLTIYCGNANYYYYAATYIAIFLLPLVIITMTYFSILHIALIQIRAIESSHVELQIQGQPSSPNQDEKARVKNSQQRKRDRELKATKSVAIVYFAFLLCWFPNCVINLIIMFDNTYFPELKKTNKTLFNFVLYCFIHILPMVNTMINPIIYSFSNKQFQKAFKIVFNRVLKRFENNNDSLESITRRNTHLTLDGLSSPRSTRSNSSQSAYSLTDRVSRYSVPQRNLVPL